MSILLIQALIKFKNYFYFEVKDEQVEEFEKVCSKSFIFIGFHVVHLALVPEGSKRQ